ncbi:AAC(3) family N-acetyltransferase, partial [Escherichia coli]|uniref:AAC(3) family N-acetyltransferase n=1 Tax=Escherichia coli TaxID=562 RepID=UPI003C6D99DC
VPAYGPQNDVTLKMPAFEWVHVQLHQQKGMISLSPPTICNSAEQIISDPLPLPPHSPASPVARVHELDGQVLLLGVGHDANTTLHLAELMAKVPYGVPRHCTILQDGKLVRVDYLENDHCCERFALADRWLKEKSLQKEGPVGHAFARLIRSRDIVATALGQLGRDPLIFLHPPEAGCEECDAARQSIG